MTGETEKIAVLWFAKENQYPGWHYAATFERRKKRYESLQPSVTFHIETQMTGSYMKCNTGAEMGPKAFPHFLNSKVSWKNFLDSPFLHL